ncbi:BspA family leucine-rich repeat surface protein [Lactococcus garvieae]|uniref:BspA family leucine-rich repeat surface protein n=1 Tax=Lactococcus garvieae TaxID=1363 RepID=UPI001F60D135|nr:BspA family leucine-rich repeat surface protein [Lactococcus garvieae]MCI3861349.1 DUF285 domain-containing protein [Lactococcus garvieae]
MKQKNKFQRMVRFFCTLFIITFTFLFFIPLVSALDNDENMQQEGNSELQLSQDVSIQTSSSQKNEVQAKNIASGKFGTSEWVIDDSGCLHIGEGTFAPNAGAFSPWGAWAYQINSIIIEGRVILDQNSSYLFFDLKKVETISGLSNMDTSEVNIMDSMFRDTSSLTKLDLSSFDTSKVTTMNSMFRDASSLTKLDLSSFDTSKVTAMSDMFTNVFSLTELDLSSFNTSAVIIMLDMFRGADNISQLRLGENFEFKGWTSLPSVPITDKYTGKWRNVSQGSIDIPSGSNIWSSEEFVNKYRGSSDADTYVWQKRSFITEYYYDTEGESLKAPVVTEVDGAIFTPQPEKYKEVNGILYLYKGWSGEPPESGASINVENPPSTTVEMTYYYVYEKADKFINVTIPTEIVFGTEEHSKNITSKNYDIKNNSNDVDLQMTLATFEKVNSDIQLLDETSPDPSGKENSARLDLLVGGETALSGLNEKVSEQELGNIKSGKTTTLALTGTYFGDLSERHKVEYKTNLKFKAQAKVEN